MTSIKSTVSAAETISPLALGDPPAAAAPAEQAESARPGYTGMWVGITCEFVEFAVFFVVYFIARWSYPDVFRAGSGAVLPIDEVAHAAGTVGYELMCALAPRVPVSVEE